jgi:Peptidase A4 family
VGGLDGATSSDVCQAGVLETVQTTPGGNTIVSCSAWDEWSPAAINTISSSDLTVNPGGTVRVTAETVGKGSTSAAFLFDDVTTGQTYQTGLTAPSGTSLQGDSAEFVVETPEWQYGNMTFQPLLADIVPSPVTFQSQAQSMQTAAAPACPVDSPSGW